MALNFDHHKWNLGTLEVTKKWQKVQGQLQSSRVKRIPQDSLSWKMNPALVVATTSIKFKSAFLHA